MVTWLLIAIISFIVCIILFVIAIKQKNRKSIYISLLFLFISLGAGVYTGVFYVARIVIAAGISVFTQ